MGFSINQIRLLTLTERKADLELDIALGASRKMAKTREMTDLNAEYRAKLNSKNISYYANSQYNKMTYNYLMGYGKNTLMMLQKNPDCIKSDNRMLLTDSAGLVVLGSSYVSTMTKVLGASCMDAHGRGSTFSKDKIPALIAEIGGYPLTEENVKTVIDGGQVEYGYDASSVQTLTGKTTSTGNNHDASATRTEQIQTLVNFFYPIFMAAASNGWTTEYNQDMEMNDNYISDALVSGTFQLVQTNEYGNYDPDTSLTYFTLSGLVFDKTDASVREAVTAWYNEEKERINEDETIIDLDMQNWSTELESVKTEIEAVKSLQEDAMKPFEWCT